MRAFFSESEISISKIEMSDKKIHITVNGKLYDMTEFAPVHPGGCSVIHSFAGKDATDVFNMIHASVPWIEETLQKMEIQKSDLQTGAK